MKQIEIFSKFLPLGSIFLILCSSIRLVTYYNFFNISIVYFLGIEEYVSLFVADILYYILTFGAGLIIYYFLGEQKRDNFDFSIYKGKKLYVKKIAILLLILTIFLCFLSSSNSILTLFIGIGIFLQLGLLHVYSLWSKIHFFKYLHFLTIAMLNYVIMFALKDGYTIIENKDKLNYCIEFKEKIIETNDNLHFLGKSEKYIFLYNLINKEAIVLLNEDLIKINIIEKNIR